MPNNSPNQDDDLQQFMNEIKAASSGQPSSAPVQTAVAAPVQSSDPDMDDFTSEIQKATNAGSPRGNVSAPLSSPTEQAGPKNWAPTVAGTPDNPTPWATVAKSAAQNIIPSTGRAALGIYEAFRHPMDTASTLGSIVSGIDSKIEGYAGRQQDPTEKAQKEAVVNALMQNYADRYGDIEKVKNTLSNNPADLLLDASTIFAGPQMALGEGAGVAGSIGRASGIASRALNPLNPAGILTKTLDVAAPASKTTSLNSNVDNAIKTATNGKLSAQDFIDPNNPSLRSNAEQIFGSKGVNPASINEATLRSFNAPAPEPVVVGKPAHPMTQQAVDNAVKDGHVQAAATGADLVGAPAPSPTNLAEQLENSYINSYNGYRQAYDKVSGNTGTFDPSIGQTVMPAISAELKSYKLPSTPELMAKNVDLPQANQALQYVNDRLVSNDMPLGSDINMSNLDRVRQGLNSFLVNAEGSDKQAVRAIIDGYDKNIINSAQNGLFSGDGDAIVNDMNNARQLFKNHMDTFNNPTGNNSYIAKATKQFSNDPNGFQKDPSGIITSPSSTEVHNSVQAGIGKALLDPAKGPDLYNKLLNAMGGSGSAGEQELNNFIRQSMMESQNGVLKLNPDKIDAMINTPNGVAQRVFSPQELSTIRRINYGRRVLMSKPTGPAHAGSLASDLGGQLVRAAGASAFGHVVGGYPGAVIAGTAERGAEGLLAKRRIAQAMRGAPNAPNKIGALGNLGRAAVNPKITDTLYQLQQGNQLQQQADGGRIERASGGRIIDHEAEADHLVRAAEMAKNKVNQSTEKLLNVPDEAIIKALDVAQQAI